MIYLCSCGFGIDDRDWIQGHLFEYPGHHERPASQFLAAVLVIRADIARNR